MRAVHLWSPPYSRWIGAAALLLALMVIGCTAGDPRVTAEAPAGFWLGLWHGAISWVTLVVGLFREDVRVYELHNSGALYDLGFLLGVILVHGSGSHTAAREAPRDRSRDQEAWEGADVS